MTRKILFLFVFLAACAFPQAVRFDGISSTTNSQCAPGAACPLLVIPGTQVNFCSADGIGIVNTAGTVVTLISGPSFVGSSGSIQIGGNTYQIQTVVSSSILVLVSPGAGTQTNATYSTLSGCLSVPATTYTDASAGASCPATAQLTPSIGGPCVSTADKQGNYGGWFMPGSYYFYLRTPTSAGGKTIGPYPIALGASVGCPLGQTCDANYDTLQSAITAAGSGTLYVTRAWTVGGASIVINTSLAIICQSTGAIIQGGNFPMLTYTSTSANVATLQGCAVTGAYATYTTDCIDINGASNIRIISNKFSHCGVFGIHLNGDSSANHHIKILNNNFNTNHDDAVFSEGSLTDLEMAGNYADCSTGEAFTHCFAVHNGDNAGITHGPVQSLNIHDNIQIPPSGGEAMEILAFVTGYPPETWPQDVHLSHNTCLIASGLGVPPACDSFGFANNVVIDGDVIDAQGNVFAQGPEIAGATNAVIHGVVQTNCNAAQAVGMTINQASQIELSGFSLCGQLTILLPPSPLLSANMDDINIHDGSITLQSGFVTAAPIRGVRLAGIWAQLAQSGLTMNRMSITHLRINGVSYADGVTAILLEDDPCSTTTTMNQLNIEKNYFQKIQYGVGNFTSCQFINEVQYTGNFIGVMSSGGTVQTTSGGTAVVGTGTLFDAGLIGATFTVNNAAGVASGTVSAVADQTHLTLNAVCSACQSASGQAYGVTSTEQFNVSLPFFGSIAYNNPGFAAGSFGFSLPQCKPGPALGSMATCDIARDESSDKVILINITTGSGATTGVLFTLFLNPSSVTIPPPGEFIGSPDVITGWGYQYSPSQALFTAGTPGLVFQTNSAPTSAANYQVSVTIN